MKDLTAKEIQIIYGYLFDINNFINYVKGYRPFDRLYDVYEGTNFIQIYYAAGGLLPVTCCYTKSEFFK